jgi:hypothetical protein
MDDYIPENVNEWKQSKGNALVTIHGKLKKKRHQRITCIFSMFQNTFIENVVINIYGVIYALARQ